MEDTLKDNREYPDKNTSGFKALESRLCKECKANIVIILNIKKQQNTRNCKEIKHDLKDIDAICSKFISWIPQHLNESHSCLFVNCSIVKLPKYFDLELVRNWGVDKG